MRSSLAQYGGNMVTHFEIVCVCTHPLLKTHCRLVAWHGNDSLFNILIYQRPVLTVSRTQKSQDKTPIKSEPGSLFHLS